MVRTRLLLSLVLAAALLGHPGTASAAGWWQRLGTEVNASSTGTVHDATARAGAPWVTISENSALYLKSWNGSQWVATGGNIEFDSSRLAYRSGVAFDGSGTPFVAWGETTSVSASYDVRAARWDGSSWVHLGALDAVQANDAHSPSIAAAGSDVYVAFVEEATNAAGDDQLRVQRWNGSAWSAVGGVLNLDATAAVNSPDIAILGGQPVVTWVEPDNNGTATVHVSRWNGSAWGSLGTARNRSSQQNAARPRLAVHGSDLYLSFSQYDGTTYNGVVDRWDGSSWTSLGGAVATGTASSNASTVTVPADGFPVVMVPYKNDAAFGAMRGYRWDGAAWTLLGWELDVYPSTTASEAFVVSDGSSLWAATSVSAGAYGYQWDPAAATAPWPMVPMASRSGYAGVQRRYRSGSTTGCSYTSTAFHQAVDEDPQATSSALCYAGSTWGWSSYDDVVRAIATSFAIEFDLSTIPTDMTTITRFAVALNAGYRAGSGTGTAQVTLHRSDGSVVATSPTFSMGAAGQRHDWYPTGLSLTRAEVDAMYVRVAGTDPENSTSNYVALSTISVVANGTPPPLAPPAPVADGSDPLADVDGTQSDTTLAASWAALTHPELAGFEYCFATAATSSGCSGTTLVPWTSVAASSTSISRTGLALVEGQNYVFCIRSVNVSTAVTSPTCTDGQVVDLQAPGAATQVSPTTGSSASGSVTFTATYADPAPGTTGVVVVEVCSDAPCSVVVTTGSSGIVSSGTNATWTPTGLASGTYHWRVRNRDAAGRLGPWSGTWSFTFNAPPDVTITSPEPDGWVTSATPALTVDYVDPDATSGRAWYELCQVDASGDWATTCGSSYQTGASSVVASGASAQWAPPTPIAQGTWYWRVRGADQLGATSAWSPSQAMRVDSIVPSAVTGVSVEGRGLGRVDLVWNPSSDSGSGGVTYDVETSTDGTTWSALCTDITARSCTRSGLGGAQLVFFRVRACDAAGNCTSWTGSSEVTAGAYYFRTAASTHLTATANRLASVAPVGTQSQVTIAKHDGGTGWFQFRPQVTNGVAVASEPVATPSGSALPNGGSGWAVDASRGRTLAQGGWQVVVTTLASSSDGVGRVRCRAWIADGGASITGVRAYQAVAANVTDAIDGLTTVSTCSLPGLASQTTLGPNETVYVEAWLDVTTRSGGGNNSVRLLTEDTSSYVAIPPPGTAPGVPTLVAPALGTVTGSTPTLEATHQHPAGLGGALEFQLCSDAACGTVLEQGTSTVVAAGANGTYASQGRPAGQTLHWRARARAVDGLASGWSATSSFRIASAPGVPTHVSPGAGATLATLTPTLQASAFSDADLPSDSHQAAQFMVRRLDGSWLAPVADSGTLGGVTSWTVPGGALTDGVDYAWRVRYRDSFGLWSSWSTDRALTISSTATTVSVSSASPSLGLLAVGTNAFASTTVTVTTGDPQGYTLTATDASDTTGLGCTCGTSIADWTGTSSTPTTWTAATSGWFGVTVRDATGGRSSRWGTGTGTVETDVTNNQYAGLQSSSPLLLHASAAPTAGDSVVVTWRANPGSGLSPGTYSSVVTLTAVGNP